MEDALAAFESATMKGLRLRRALLRDNDPALAILDLANRNRAALILMPTFGTGPYRKLVLGSITEKVLQGADCPVWTSAHVVGRMGYEPRPIRRLVCAVDRDSRARRVLEWVRDFSRKIKAAVTVVHAVSPFQREPESLWSHERRRDAEAALNRRLDELEFRADVHVETGEVTPVVGRASENLNADLLVIGRSSESGRFGSIATNSYSLIRHSHCPVVSV
jgi:nucleotide-binding universal stress UspA family protein